MSNDLNKWVGIGRLVRDSELKYVSNGTPICRFAIAVGNRIKKNDEWVEDVSFFEVVIWGKSGESLNPYLVKGKQVAVEGELHQNRWEQDGQSRSKIEINANNVQLLGGNAGASGQGAGNASSDPAHVQNRAGSAGKDDGMPPDFPDDIPF